MIQLETIQKFGRDSVDAALRSFTAVSTGAQTAAVETVDYAKRSFEQGTHATERLLGARTLDNAIQIQGEYVRTSYEGLIAQASKMGELATTTAKEAFAPVESLFAKSLRTS